MNKKDLNKINKILEPIGAKLEYVNVNLTKKELDNLAEEMIKPYKETIITKPKKQSTKEMFKKMASFFFKSFCNCKK
jgi:predicted nuclease with TOPRIM domain